VIGLIGRLYDDPRRIAQTHEAVLEAIEEGDPQRITEQLDLHIRVAWREVAKLVREIPISTHGASV
jgi:DNA-binding GntR family transcriptional regulator